MDRFALLVVDMLNDYFSPQTPLAGRRESLTRSINTLVRAFHQHGQPVIWIRQEFAADLSDAFLDMRRRGIRITIAGTQGSEVLPELERLPTDPTIVKKRYSAFFGTNLDPLLSTLDPKALVVAGINTHACIRTTIVDAYQRDYDVIAAEECIASYDPEHHAISRRYLEGKIARFLPNGDILKLLTSEHAV